MSGKGREHASTSSKRVAPPRELALVAVGGDLPVGEEFLLPSAEPLHVGRAAKGIQLSDPLVSINHAIIKFDEKNGYVIQDLKSATGTWVDEECVRDGTRAIGVGTRLRFGDTVFEVQPAHRTPRWVKLVGAGAVALIVVAVGLFAAQQVVAPPVPELGCPESSIVGAVSFQSLKVPTAFLRERGLVLSQLTCSRTGDDNDDGKVEAWVKADTGAMFVVMPGDADSWTLLGELPADCSPRGTDAGGDYPLLDCMGEQWMWMDGAYQFVGHEGVVVWYEEPLAGAEPEPEPEPAPKTDGAPPDPMSSEPIELPGVRMDREREIRVGRFALRGDRLGAFLSFRGVDRPIHYLICEDAFKGIAAQALLDDETIVPLKFGCISDLRLQGPPDAKPLAIALSPAGRRALVSDVTTFYAGNPDGLFLPPEYAALVESISADPGALVGTRKLVGDTRESDAPPIAPFPDPARQVTSAHVLDPRDSRMEPAPLASTVLILNEGDATVDLPGCAQLQLRTGPFVRLGFSSLASKPFITVDEIGCGPPRRLGEVGYLPGVTELPIDGLDLRVVTESSASTRGVEIARARLTWHE